MVRMAKWVKWNIRVEHEVVFLLLSLLLGLSEDVLYLDNYAMLLCLFKYWYVCVLHSIFFDIFVSEVRYFIHQIVVIVQSMWHSLSLRNYLLVLARRIRATVLWAKPFDCEKLNKIDFKLFSSCFRHLCISLRFRFADHRDVLSPDLFSHDSRSPPRSNVWACARNCVGSHRLIRKTLHVAVTTAAPSCELEAKFSFHFNEGHRRW